MRYMEKTAVIRILGRIRELLLNPIGALLQQFSNFSVHQEHGESMLKHRPLYS